MKLSYLKYSIIGLVLLGVVSIIHSCKKESKAQPATISDPAIIRAKAWYEATYPITPDNNQQVTQNVNSSKKDWSGILSPYWDKGVSFTSKGLDIVELPAMKKGDLAFSTQTADLDKFNFGNSNSVTSLLVVKQEGTYGIYAMTIMADPTYLQGNHAKLKNNTYRKRDKDFTGMVFYHKLDGTFVNGWRYVNGKVTTGVYLHGTTEGTVTQVV